MTVLVGSSHFISSKVNKVFLFACTFWTHLDILNSAQMRIPHGVCEVIRALQWTNPGRFSPDSENDKRLLKILNTPLIFAQNINIALIWRGLNLLCRRDAVREADGEAMMSFFKFDLVHFFGNKHPKYVILAHRLLASVNGWLSPKLRHDLFTIELLIMGVGWEGIYH